MKISPLISLCILYNEIIKIGGLNFYYGRQGTKRASFERFNNTCGGPKQPIIFTYTGMRAEGSVLFLNSTIHVKEDTNIDPKLTVSISRCKSKENLDSCEHFFDYNMDHYCWTINTYSPLWSPFYETFEPKFPCPMKKGFYKGTNSPVDTSALLLFPLEAYYWKVKTETLEKDTNRIFFCVIVEAHIIASKTAN